MTSCSLSGLALSRVLSPFTRTGGAFIALLAALVLAVSGRAAGAAPTISPPFADQTYYAQQRVATETAISFTLADADTAAPAFINNAYTAYTGARIAAISDNPNLILPADMATAIGGSGTSRTLTIKHQPNITGVANVTVTISDGVNQITPSFKVTVLPAPASFQMLYNPGRQAVGDTQLLTFSNLNDQKLALQSNGATEPLSLTLTVTKGTISLSGITGLSFTAGDGTADASMTFSGTVANINAALTNLVYDFDEVANPSATSDTLTMSTRWTDGSNSVVTQVVPLQIGKAPLVSSITDIAVPLGVAVPAIPFTMVDRDSSPSQVRLVFTSSNTSLLPLSGITVTPGTGASSTTGGATGNYSLTVTPTQGSTGSSIVTVTATDPAGFRDTKSFKVEVGSLKASIGAITSTSAVINAEVTSDAAGAITERGVIYALASAASEPKKGDTGVTAVTTSGTLGAYNLTLSGLAPNSVYVARSYAINATGASYSSVLTFSTNVAPVITSNGGGASAAISVDENVSAVTTVTATDADSPAQTLTYAIDGGADAAKFSINATSGALTFVTAPDFEAPADAGGDNVYNVTVKVTDNGNTPKSATQDLAITVTNVAEAPVLAAPTAASVFTTWATLGGTVTTNGGGGTITEQGIVYAVTSSNATPQIGGSGVTKVASTGAALSVALTGLAKETTYSYRTYATNATGTGYSAVGTFTTLGDGSAPAFGYGANSGRTFNLNDAITAFSPAQGGGALTGGVYLNVTTVMGQAGSGFVDAATTATAKVNGPRGLALAANGDLYIADTNNHRIRRITAAGAVETVVGSTAAFSDTTGSVKFNQPMGLALDRANNVLYVADHLNHRIRKVNLAANPVTVTTIAGSGTAGANDGTGTAATLNKPCELTLNAAGTILYVTELGSHIVRKITLATNAVARVAGSVGSSGSADGAGLTTARFNQPAGIAVDAAGNLFVSEFSGHRIRKITAAGDVSTVAGTGSIGGTDGVGTAASFNQPCGLQFDGAGNLYVAEANSNRIRRITPAGDVVTLIGTSYSGTADGVGRASSVGGPMSLLVDPTGVMYVSDTATSRIRRVQLAGYTLSHPLPAGMTFDPATGRIGGTPTEASLQTVFANDFSTGLGTGTVNNDAVRRGDAVELTPNAGNKFGGFSVPASGTAGGVVKVNFSLITTKASGGADGVSWSFADDTNATDTTISAQGGTGTKLAVSFDNFNNGSTGGIGVRVVYGPKVSGLPNSVSGAVKGFSNSTAWIGTAVPVSITTTTDGKTTVTMAGTEVLSGIALDAAYAAADKSTWKHVFKGATGGSSDLHAIDDLVIQQGAGMATYTVTAYNFYGSSSATLELKTEVGPLAATFASGGDVGQTRAGFTDNLTLGTLTLGFAPTLGQKLTLVNNTGSAASTGRFTGLAEGGTVTANYNGDTFTFTITYAGGTGNDVVLERVLATGQSLQAVGEVTTLAGSSSGSADGTGTTAQFNEPTGVAVDGSGNVYVADKSNHRIRKITAGGVVTTLAGSTPGFADGAGTAARFRSPHGVAVDRSGNVYVGDYENHRIRKITAGGVVTTLTGSTQGFADGARNTAKFRGVKGVALDGSGNVYVADMFNNRIRKITADGVVSTLAGALQGFADGTGFSAQFKFPDGVAVDGSGNVYVADWLNYRIRKITAGGVVTTLAGSSSYGFADGAGAAAKFAGPIGVAVDGSGNVYVVEDRMHRVRKITAGGVVTTLAGSSDLGYADGTGASAKFWNTQGVAVDGSGQIYVAEIGNHLIRKISPGDARPIVTAAAATAVGASTAVLNGTVNPNGLMTTAVFEYGTTTSYGSTAAVTLTPNNGTAAQAVASAALTGLAGNTTYFYRLKATNVDGTAVTASGTFSTTALGKPTVLVASTSAITATGATVSGSVSSDGGTAITERGVAYRVSGSGSPFTKVVTTGTTGALSVGLTGLTAATTYDVQAYAVNTVGESVGESTSLTTLKAVAVAAAPTITSITPAGNAISVSFTAGADGGAAITNYKYSLDGGTTWIAFSPAVTTSPATITGLTAGTPYNVQVRAVTSAGDGVASTTQSVTLSSKLVVTSAATVSGAYGTPFTYTITAAGSPTSFSATGLPTGLSVATGTGVISGTPTQAGSFTVTLGATTSSATANQTLTLTIAKAPLTVTADASSRGFGQENPAFTATITGFVLGDSATVISGTPEFTTTATTDSVTGSYPITPAQGSLSSANYRFATFTPGSLSVGKQTATVTLGNLAQTYDGTARAAKATTSPDAVTVGLSYAGTGGTTYGPSATAPTNAGSYTVTATINDTKFTGTATGTLVVAKASQTITIAPLPSAVALNTLTTVNVAGTASSGLPVTFTLDTGSAAALSGTVGSYSLSSLNGSTGTVKLLANQAGNDNYLAAPQATADFEVTKSNQTITFTGPGDQTYSPAGANTVTLTASSVQAVDLWETFSGSAGQRFGIDGPVGDARYAEPNFLARDPAGNIYVTTTGNRTVRKITPGGVVSLLAGTEGISGSDDGVGAAAKFTHPAGIASDSTGTLYLADRFTYSIRRVTSTGTVTTIAGLSGTSGSSDGTASVARFNEPTGVAIDANNDIYVTDRLNHTIRKITPAGVVTTFAGSAGTSGSTDGSGGAARFSSPAGLAIDASGNLYVGDSGNSLIRKITPDGTVSTVAGIAGQSGSTDGPVATAKFGTTLFGLSVTSDGTLYVGDTDNHLIRKISGGKVSTIGGSALTSGAVDGTEAESRFNQPRGLLTDSSGRLIVADYGNSTLRRLGPGTRPTGLTVSFARINGTDVVPIAGNTLTLTGPGKVVVRAIQAGDTTYNPAPSVDRVFNVTRSVQSQTITFPAIAGVTYGVAPFALSATASSALPVTFVVVSGPATIAAGTLTVTGAGSITVQASQAGNDDFSAAAPVEQTFAVSPKALTVTGATAQSKSYDGTNAAVIAGATLSGVVTGDTVGLGKATEGTFGQTGVGTNLAVSTAMTLTGADAANYTLTQPSGLTASITGITLTVSGVTVADKIYDGTATATASFTNAKLIGLAAADTGSVTLNSSSATATFAAGKTVGTGKTVNITGLTLNGAPGSNYTLTQPTATADISRKTIYVTGVTVADRAYNGSRTAALSFSSAAPSGVVSPDVVSIDSSGATGLFESADVGTDRGIAITGVTLGGADKDNYTVGQPSARASITVKELTVAGITVTPRAYNGGVAATLDTTGASLVVVESGDVANVALVKTDAAGTYADALVGTGKTVQVTGLFLSGTRAGNYRLTQPSVTGAITGQPVTVTGILGINKPYDGTTNAQLDTKGATLVGAPAGSGVVLNTTGATGAFTTAAAGVDKDVQVSGLTLDGPTASNFTLTQPTVKATITTPALTVTGISASPKVYDRTTTATVNLADARLEGVVSGDTVELVTTGATATFDTLNVGKNKTVTVAGLTLGGADAAKYALQQPTVSSEITAKPLTVSGVTAADKVYDAALETTASFTGATLNGVIAGDSVSLNTQFAAASFADKNVGNGKALTVSGLALSGAAAANYSVGTVSSSASVTKATLTVEGVTAGMIVYGSGAPAPLDFSAAQLVGIMPQDDVALVSSAATGAFDNLNAGVLKTVTITGLTLSGVDAGNYALTVPVPTGNVLQAPVSFTIGTPAFVYDGTPKVVTVSATPVVPYYVTYAENGRALAMPPTNVGTYDVYAAVSDLNYSGNASATLTIKKAAQTIALKAPASATLADAVAVSAASSSGLPVALSVTGPATLVQGTLRFTAPGTAVITATQAGNANYAEASATASVTVVGKAPQTIAFAAPGDRLSNSGPLTLSATATSGLPVTFSVVSGPALISGNVVTLRGDAGRVIVRASQAGDARFDAATDVTVSFQVTAATVNVFFGNLTFANQSGPAPKVGDVAAAVPPNSNRGSLLVVAPAVGLNRALDFQFGADGTFEQTFIIDGPAASGLDSPPVAAAPVTVKLKGRLVGGRLSGTVEPLGLTFDAPVQPVVGTSANAAGFYRSSTLANTAGATYSIVGTNSQVLVLATTPAVTTGGLTTLGNDGTFALQTTTTAGAATIRGTVDEPTTTVAGSISIAGTTTQFAGLVTTTTRTDRLVNLSSRVRISGGDSVLITGFVIGGAAPKQVLVRGIGPALTGFGVGGALANPKLKIYRGSTLVSENDDWSADTAGSFSRVGAFGLTAGSRDAALVVTLEPGAYTAHVSDGGAAGVALAEIYDASVNPAGEYQRLINISTRGEVTAGEGVLIGGFVVTGNSPKRLLIRGVGPGLAAFGVGGVLADPRLRVYRNADLQAENDNWSAVAAEGTASADAAREAGAFALAAGSRDSALIVTLAPGAYTAQITSADGTATGSALIEIYELP